MESREHVVGLEPLDGGVRGGAPVGEDVTNAFAVAVARPSRHVSGHSRSPVDQSGPALEGAQQDPGRIQSVAADGPTEVVPRLRTCLLSGLHPRMFDGGNARGLPGVSFRGRFAGVRRPLTAWMIVLAQAGRRLLVGTLGTVLLIRAGERTRPNWTRLRSHPAAVVIVHALALRIVPSARSVLKPPIRQQGDLHASLLCAVLLAGHGPEEIRGAPGRSRLQKAARAHGQHLLELGAEPRPGPAAGVGIAGELAAHGRGGRQLRQVIAVEVHVLLAAGRRADPRRGLHVLALGGVLAAGTGAAGKAGQRAGPDGPTGRGGGVHCGGVHVAAEVVLGPLALRVEPARGPEPWGPETRVGDDGCGQARPHRALPGACRDACDGCGVRALLSVEEARVVIDCPRALLVDVAPVVAVVVHHAVPLALLLVFHGVDRGDVLDHELVVVRVVAEDAVGVAALPAGPSTVHPPFALILDAIAAGGSKADGAAERSEGLGDDRKARACHVAVPAQVIAPARGPIHLHDTPFVGDLASESGRHAKLRVAGEGARAPDRSWLGTAVRGAQHKFLSVVGGAEEAFCVGLAVHGQRGASRGAKARPTEHAPIGIAGRTRRGRRALIFAGALQWGCSYQLLCGAAGIQMVTL